jgi:predicted MFS family arabinose efflux permease
VPFGNVLAAAAGSWRSVFLVAAVMNAAAALAALVVAGPYAPPTAPKRRASKPVRPP